MAKVQKAKIEKKEIKPKKAKIYKVKSRRNFWDTAETRTMLSIMHSENCLKLFDEGVLTTTEIFQLIRDELIKRGFVSKNEKQIEIRWKNLKRDYVAATRGDEMSLYYREKVCPFYEQLDVLLNQKSLNFEFGIDTSRFLEESNPDENDLSKSKHPVRKVSRKYSPRGSYASAMEKLEVIIKSTVESTNQEFFDQMRNVFRLQLAELSKKELEYSEYFNSVTGAILSDNTSHLLNGMRDIFDNSETNTSIRDYFTSFS